MIAGPSVPVPWPRHVLMTADAVGGVWTYALELARALAPRGTRVTLAVLGPPPSASQRSEAAQVPGLTLHARDFRLEWMDDAADDVARSGEWLLELERAVEPDLVHLNGYAHGALPFRAPTVVVAHSCVCTWWRAVKGEAAPAHVDGYREATRRGLHAAGLVVAPTRAMLEMVVAEYGAPRDVAVVHNGRRAPSAHGVTKEPFVLGAGRLWDEAKNVAALAAVAPRLPWPVYAAGAEQGPAGEHVAQSLGVAHAPEPGPLRALGVLAPEAMAWWMEHASIFASPARYEPFGLAALEAGLAGCALVLGDLPSLREVWGDAATFVAPDDHAALERAIERLAADPVLCKEMGERARHRAQRYTVDRFADGYLAAYARLLDAEPYTDVAADVPEATLTA